MTNRNAVLLAVWLLTVSFSLAFAAGSGGSSGGAAGAGGRSGGTVTSRSLGSGRAAVGLGVGGPGISTGLGGLQSTSPGFGTGIPGATITATPSNPFGVIGGGGVTALGPPAPIGIPGTGVGGIGTNTGVGFGTGFGFGTGTFAGTNTNTGLGSGTGTFTTPILGPGVQGIPDMGIGGPLFTETLPPGTSLITGQSSFGPPTVSTPPTAPSPLVQAPQ